MSYNLLNLASQVRWRAPGSTGQNSSVVGETVYYADGTRAGVMDPESGYWTARYIGSLIYHGESGEELLDGIQTGDGYIDCHGGGVGNAEMQYFLRDHLGSVRVVASDRNTVLRRSDYLPFGVRMEMDDLQQGVGRSGFFGFSGKENEMWPSPYGSTGVVASSTEGSTTGAHEIGHTLGMLEGEGIMHQVQDDNRTMTVSQESIGQMLNSKAGITDKPSLEQRIRAIFVRNE